MTAFSDKALSIFAFALYHELASGEAVTGVVLDDGAGHAADPEGVEELRASGLADVSENRIVFTPEGAKVLARMSGAVRNA